jgi:MoaA/NifB/PqqE/SkfB family radical SAM enzyme
MMKKASIAWALLRSKFGSNRIPLFVSWIITNRCNYHCAYCNPPQGDSGELSTREVLGVVGELAQQGARKISFTGGEPLLRNDLGEILAYCRARGMVTSVNSNGSLVPGRIRDLRPVDVINISLDGPEEIHDSVRGKGSFRAVVNAVEAAQAAGVRVSFFITLSKFNVAHLAFFLKIARQYRSLMYFQPGEFKTLRGPGMNPYVHLEDEYREFIRGLIAAKKSERFIGNSISGLRHLSYWPDRHPPMTCWGGRLFCRIDANGDVKICGRANGTRPAGNVRKDGFKRSFENIQPVSCDFCWCAHRVEFNYVLNGDIPAMCNCVKIG